MSVQYQEKSMNRANESNKDPILYIPIGSESEDILSKLRPVGKDEVVYIFDIDNTLFVGNRMLKMEAKIIEDIFQLYMKNEYKSENLTFKELYSNSGLSYDFIFETYCGIPRNKLSDIIPHLIDIYVPKEYVKESDINGKLRDLEGRKFCCTNGGYKRAKKNIEHLEVDAHIEAVYHFDHNSTSNIFIKPNINVFKYIEKTLDIRNRSNVYFFDDEERNYVAAKEFGWNAYLISKENTLVKALEQAKSDIENKKIFI